MYDTVLRKGTACAAAIAMIAGGASMVKFKTAADEVKPLSLMCLGDSITDGFWMAGGYRNTLCALITENGQQARVDMVGPNWGGTGYDTQHAGYSGYSVDNIAQEDSISGQRTGISSFVDWLMTDYPADVVFLQIGTNDILSLYDLEHYGARLESLVDHILPALPENGALYLATLPCMDATDTLYINEYYFTVESMDAAVEQCNAQIRALVEKKRSEGARIVLADVNAVLEKSDLYDGVHPNEEGYRKLGTFWYTQLCDYWNGEADQPQNTHSSMDTTEPSVIPAMLLGDVNKDGSVSMADAVVMVKYLSCDAAADTISAPQADMNTDGRITAEDLTLLKHKLMQQK